jgi:hypothetical protein
MRNEAAIALPDLPLLVYILVYTTLYIHAAFPAMRQNIQPLPPPSTIDVPSLYLQCTHTHGFLDMVQYITSYVYVPPFPQRSQNL